MGDFTKVSATAFNEIQKETGVILSTFDPTLKTKMQDSDILFTTTGGIQVNYKKNYTDFGEDLDNVPNGTMELMQDDDDEASISGTAVNITVNSLIALLGAADSTSVTGATGGTLTKVTSRELKITDFKDFWWVGDMTDGGFCAVHLKRGLSTDGFGLKTTKKGKGNVSFTITGHKTLSNLTDPKMEFYVFKKTTS